MRDKIAISYCRVSTQDQAENTSLDAQDALNREKLRTLGYNHVLTLRETYSGAEFWDRPELSRAREMIRRGEVGMFCAMVVDRLSRDLAHLAVFIYECERVGFTPVFAKEEFDNTAEGKLVRAVKAYAGEVERLRFLDRSATAKRRIVHEQKRLLYPGMRKLGYYPGSTENPARAINEAEAEIVRRIFTLAAEGYGHHSIVRKLHQEGALTPAGQPFQKSQIARILSDPAYKGDAYAFRYASTGKAKARRVKIRPDAEHVLLPPGTIPPIVPAEIWDAAQSRKLTNGGETTRNERKPYLLRGLIFCLACGRKMTPDTEKQIRVYRCASRYATTGRCGGKRVRADTVEGTAWDAASQILGDSQALTLAQDLPDEGPRTSAREAELKRRIARIEAQQARLVNNLADLDAPDLIAIARRKLESLSKDRQKLKTELSRIEQSSAEEDARAAALAEVLAFAAYLGSLADREVSFENRRKFLELLGLSVRASGNEIELEFRP